jgi:phosphoribosylglycinamide formyltransferase-1
LQAIIDAIRLGELNADLKLVFSNKECYAIERAKKENIETSVLAYKKEGREKYDKKVAEILDGYDIDLIVLVGYMRLFSGWFVKRYQDKIINIHPSLLPAFPGMDLDVHQAVIDYGCKITGMTIHFVDEGMDTGPIIIQKCVEVSNDETKESLKEKVQALEKKWYPKVIKLFTQGKVKKRGRKVFVEE